MATSTDLRPYRQGIALILFAGMFALSGCLTSFHSLRKWEGVNLQVVDSAAVRISKAWFEAHDDRPLIVAGIVSRTGAADTTQSEIVLTALDVHGNELFSARTRFDPPDLPRLGRPGYSHGSFRFELGILPPKTHLVVLRAMDG